MAIVTYGPSLALESGIYFCLSAVIKLHICISNMHFCYTAMTALPYYNKLTFTVTVFLVTGLPIWVSILLIGVVCTFYTTIVSLLKFI